MAGGEGFETMVRHPAHARHPWPHVLAVALLLLASPLAAGAQGIHLGVTPTSLNVNPGAQFDVDLSVTEAGSSFNGFDVVVSYDPLALTLVALSPTTLQQGCLMTGGCSTACGTTFHRFSAAGDSASITDILLCNQISLTGPGQVYTLRFVASQTPQLTHVRIRRAQFYDAGLYVNPMITEDAQIVIGTPVGVGEHGVPSPVTRLRAVPNPGRGSMRFEIEASPSEGISIDVHDVSGRLVRHLSRAGDGGTSRTLLWDGRDDSGARVPPGVYLVTLTAGGRAARARVALLR